jgi:hypothetical protein
VATTEDYIEYVCDQVSDTGAVRNRKMFGEYMVYINDKPVLLVCDNTVFIKKLPCITGLMTHAQTGQPYQGAREHYILDMDDADLVRQVIPLLEKHTDIPKKRNRKPAT